MEKQEISHTNQPTAVAPMSVNSRNVNNIPVDSEGKRGWSFPLLCGCGGGCNLFCLSMCCPCLVNTRNQRRVRYLNQHGQPDPNREELLGEDSFFGICMEAMCNATWVLQMGTRSDVRQRYNISGNAFTDCCAISWCQVCDLVQTHQEIHLEEEYLVAQGGYEGSK